MTTHELKEFRMNNIFSADVLSGEVALVTGASRGIGAAIAKELVRLGYGVVVNFFDFKDGQPDDSAAKKIQQEILDAGGVCEILRGDISSADDRQKLVDFAKKALQSI